MSVWLGLPNPAPPPPRLFILFLTWWGTRQVTLLVKRRWSCELRLSDEEMECPESAGLGGGGGCGCQQTERSEIDAWSLGWFFSSWVSWPSPGSPGSKATATVCFAVFSPPGPSHSPDRAKCTAHQGPGEQVPDVWGWSCCCCCWPLREGELLISEKWAVSCQGIECTHQAFRTNFCYFVVLLAFFLTLLISHSPDLSHS